MNSTRQKLFAFFLTLLFNSCGFERETPDGQTEVNLAKFSGDGLNQGLIIYAVSETGYMQSFSMSISSPANAYVTVKNGTYFFYAVGFNAGGGDGEIDGSDALCAMAGPFYLDGIKLDTELDFSALNCVNILEFADSNYKGSGTFEPLAIVNCNSAGRSAGDGSSDCAGSNLGVATHVKIYLPEYFSNASGTKELMPAWESLAFNSACYEFNLTTGIALTDVKVPAGNPSVSSSHPFLTIIRTYTSLGDCAGDVNMNREVRFENGISMPAQNPSFVNVQEGNGIFSNRTVLYVE